MKVFIRPVNKINFINRITHRIDNIVARGYAAALLVEPDDIQKMGRWLAFATLKRPLHEGKSILQTKENVFVYVANENHYLHDWWGLVRKENVDWTEPVY